MKQVVLGYLFCEDLFKIFKNYVSNNLVVF